MSCSDKVQSKWVEKKTGVKESGRREEEIRNEGESDECVFGIPELSLGYLC